MKQESEHANLKEINSFDDTSELPRELLAALHDTGVMLHKQFDHAKLERSSLELRWLEDLRQYKGVYSPEMSKLIPKQKSRAFVRMTRRKVKIYDARMKELLFPANSEKNWNIKKTPKVDPNFAMTPIAKAMIEERIAQQEEGGGALTQEDLESVLNEAAEKACDNMRTEIEDQLAEVKYREVCGDVLHSGNLYGTGILKAPMVQRKIERRWLPADGAWQLQKFERVLPFVEHVPIWNYYPDLQAKSLDECQYHYQLHRMNPGQLNDLARVPGFEENAAVIRGYINHFPQGDAEITTYQSELDALSVDQGTAQKAPERLYDVIEGWAMLTGKDLFDCGCEIEDEQMSDTMWANVWLLGPYVIKAEIDPLEGINHPYHAYYFDKDETCLFGEGIASVMRDDQAQLNAVRRAIMDNAGSTVSNMWDVNVDLLLPEENPRDLYPDRVFLRGGDGMAAAVRALTTPNKVPELLNLSGYVEQGIHEQTIPSYMHGATDSGAGNTAMGMSMLMGAANVDVKDQVRSFDDGITSPVIKAMYFWNMIFNEKPEIKGDFQIEARGSSSLIAKEIRVAQLDQAMGMFSNELFQPFIDYRKLAEQAMIARDLADTGIVLSEDDYKERMSLQAQIQQLQEQNGKLTTLVQLVKSMDISTIKAAEAEAERIISEKNGSMAKQNLQAQTEIGAAA